MRERKTWTLALRASLALLLLGMVLACSTDSPTAPSQDPKPPTPPSASWNITLVSTASQIGTGNQSATITITVRRASDNASPPDGSTVAVTTNLGEFSSFGSGIQSVAASLVGGQTQVVLFGGSSAGTATISAQLETSVGRLQVLISGASEFFLERIVPAFGSPQGGEEAEIFGGGFQQPVRVQVGGRVADVLEVEANRIRISVPGISLPVGETQTVNVDVTINFNGENQASDTLTQAYTYSHGSLNQPVITSISPRNGPNEGGTRITIVGDGFDSNVQVLFGQGDTNNFSGVEGTVESVTRTQIVVLSPPATAFGQNNLNQRVSVLVRNVKSGLSAIEQSAFLYGVQVLVTAIGPSSGPFYGGQIVTLYGQGFDEPVAVTLAGYGQQIVSVTGTEIVIRTAAITTDGCQDVEGPALVTNIESGNGNDTGPNYKYLVVANGPSIYSVTPNSGPIAGGTTVTIHGAGFSLPLQVFFGEGRPGNIISVSESEIVVQAPFFPERSLEEEACDDNADGTEGMRFIPTSVDLLVVVQSTTCTANFVQGYFYNPSDNTCRDDQGPVEPVDPPSAAFEYAAGSQPLEVIFTATDQTNATSFTWTIFDNTNTQIGTNSNASFAFVFPAAGTYTVRLRVAGLGGTDTNSQTIVVPVP